MLRAEYTIVYSPCQQLSSIKHQKTAVRTVEITAAQLNQRLDNFLIAQLHSVPRTRVYRIIRKGEVRVNRKRCKPDYKLQTGDLVRIPPLHVEQRPQKSRPPQQLLERLQQATLFENEHLLIIDKPAGLAVHAGSGIDYGVIDAMRLLHPDSEIELAHRLDRDTSGCLLLAKNRPALLFMQQAMRDNRLGKNYLAVVKGRWPQNLYEIRQPLKKYHLPNGERRVRVDPAGKQAISRVRLLQAAKLYSVIKVELVTGRTHQIRVHCQAVGHEIAGDEKYGDDGFNRAMRERKIRRLMLHAASLELPPGEYSPEQVINAPLPAEFEALMDA
jgi:23S rRNA pseudouridine955/2504/2580 synthase